MAKISHKTKTTAGRPHLRAIPGGKAVAGRQEKGVEELLSGRVSRAPRPKRGRKAEVALQEITDPGTRKIVDLFAAARMVEKEVEFKESYARQKLDEYCTKQWVLRFANEGVRPASIDYRTQRSRFKFVITNRTTLLPEKVDRLSELGINLEEKHTEVRGIRVNYDAIKRHHLENKLRDALVSIRVSQDIIDECFEPDVELKAGFYDRLAEFVNPTLRQGEKLEDRMSEVLDVLNPAKQVRNIEMTDMTPEECFRYVERTDVTADEDLE